MEGIGGLLDGLLPKGAPGEEELDDLPPENQEEGGAGQGQEEDHSQGIVQPLPDFPGVSPGLGTGKHRQGDHSHGGAEESHGQIDESLGVGERPDGGGAQPKPQSLVHQAVQLHQASAHQAGEDASAEEPHLGVTPVQVPVEAEAVASAGPH